MCGTFYDDPAREHAWTRVRLRRGAVVCLFVFKCYYVIIIVDFIVSAGLDNETGTIQVIQYIFNADKYASLSVTHGNSHIDQEG